MNELVGFVKLLGELWKNWAAIVGLLGFFGLSIGAKKT